ncbi:YciI family protein [Nocardioides sp.]|uniref:YciI family protein n=1 Tax=Nocardioides sp. TaxID=35761 RepID=UPI0035B3C682
MHYLFTVVGDTAHEVDDSAPGAVDAFNERLKAEGRWVFGGGLTSPEHATVTDSRGGDAVFTDGPFVESKEYLAGFWVVEADDLDVALALSADASRACHRKIEVRPFDGLA